MCRLGAGRRRSGADRTGKGPSAWVMGGKPNDADTPETDTPSSSLLSSFRGRNQITIAGERERRNGSSCRSVHGPDNRGVGGRCSEARSLGNAIRVYDNVDADGDGIDDDDEDDNDDNDNEDKSVDDLPSLPLCLCLIPVR